MTWEQRRDIIDELSTKDAHYQDMMFRVCDLEKRFDYMISKLSMEKRDLAWDFVMLCEAMSEYKLQLAYTNMVFPEENK